MLRLRPSLVLRNTHRTDGEFLAKLLPVVGDLESARNELRWLREDCQKQWLQAGRRTTLQSWVERRSRGEPLQYILGSTYFGDLEIKCRKDVFIPRPETAVAVSHLAQSLVRQISKSPKTYLQNQAHTTGGVNGEADATKLRKPRNGTENHYTLPGLIDQGQHLRVFDLCSGTGCIPLLFWHEYYRAASNVANELPELELVGFEMSEAALALARENHASIVRQQSVQRTASNVAMRSLQHMDFVQANVLYRENSPDKLRALPTVHEAINHHIERAGTPAIGEKILNNGIWISNPPYISPKSYEMNTEKSVRDFEPKTALVPPLTQDVENGTAPSSGNDGDRFHQDILEQAAGLGTEIVLLEVEDMDQAIRVATMAIEQAHWHTFEIWRDEPEGSNLLQYAAIGSKFVRVCGSGAGRSVLVCTPEGSDLIGRHALTGDEADTQAFEKYDTTEPATKEFIRE